MKRRLMSWLFVPVLGIFYGVMAAGQILATARLYYSWLVLPLSLLLSVVVILIYYRFGKDFLLSFRNAPEEKGNRWLDGAFLVSG
jgi:hypothetical protein